MPLIFRNIVKASVGDLDSNEVFAAGSDVVANIVSAMKNAASEMDEIVGRKISVRPRSRLGVLAKVTSTPAALKNLRVAIDFRLFPNLRNLAQDYGPNGTNEALLEPRSTAEAARIKEIRQIIAGVKDNMRKKEPGMIIISTEIASLLAWPCVEHISGSKEANIIDSIIANYYSEHIKAGYLPVGIAATIEHKKGTPEYLSRMNDHGAMLADLEWYNRRWGVNLQVWLRTLICVIVGDAKREGDKYTEHAAINVYPSNKWRVVVAAEQISVRLAPIIASALRHWVLPLPELGTPIIGDIAFNLEHSYKTFVELIQSYVGKNDSGTLDSVWNGKYQLLNSGPRAIIRIEDSEIIEFSASRIRNKNLQQNADIQVRCICVLAAQVRRAVENYKEYSNIAGNTDTFNRSNVYGSGIVCVRYGNSSYRRRQGLLDKCSGVKCSSSWAWANNASAVVAFGRYWSFTIARPISVKDRRLVSILSVGIDIEHPSDLDVIVAGAAAEYWKPLSDQCILVGVAVVPNSYAELNKKRELGTNPIYWVCADAETIPAQCFARSSRRLNPKLAPIAGIRHCPTSSRRSEKLYYSSGTPDGVHWVVDNIARSKYSEHFKGAVVGECLENNAVFHKVTKNPKLCSCVVCGCLTSMKNYSDYVGVVTSPGAKVNLYGNYQPPGNDQHMSLASLEICRGRLFRFILWMRTKKEEPSVMVAPICNRCFLCPAPRRFVSIECNIVAPVAYIASTLVDAHGAIATIAAVGAEGGKNLLEELYAGEKRATFPRSTPSNTTVMLTNIEPFYSVGADGLVVIKS